MRALFDDPKHDPGYWTLTDPNRFGRKTVLYAAILLKVFSNILTVFSIHYIWVFVIRFLVGVGSFAAYLAGFILSKANLFFQVHDLAPIVCEGI